MHSTSTVALFVLTAVVLAVLLTMLVFALCHAAKHPDDFQDAKVPDDWPEAPYKIEPPSESIAKQLYATGGILNPDGKQVVYFADVPEDMRVGEMRRIRFPGGSDFER